MQTLDWQQNVVKRVAVGDLADRAAARFPNNIAVADGDFQLTFSEFNQYANRIAHALLRRTVEPNTRVALLSRNSWQFLVSYFACAKAGMIAVPLNTRLDYPLLRYCLEDSGAKILMMETTYAGAVPDLPTSLDVVWYRESALAPCPSTGTTFDQLLQEGDPGEVTVIVRDRDPVQLLYTSGTTGKPKGVLTSHIAVVMGALAAYASMVETVEGAQFHSSLIVLPLFHVAALNTLALPNFFRGSTIVLMKVFQSSEALRLIEQYNVTAMTLLPIMYQALLDDPSKAVRDVSSLRVAEYGMAPMPPQRIAQLQSFFGNASVIMGSGQTEFLPPTTRQQSHHQHTKAASWGPPGVNTQAAIMDDKGNFLPRGQIGELVYRGPQAMELYWKNEEATEDAFRDGWFHSGDIAWIDEEGVVWFVDRQKDLIKSGGENIASIEVERALLMHPAVHDVAVVGLPHQIWGEAVTAMVVLSSPNPNIETELLAFCHSKLAGYKVPKAIIAIKELPRSASNKIQKHALRESYRNWFNSGGNEKQEG